MTLVKGLSHVRQRYSSDTFRIWTLSEINMAVNALGDESLECILGWAKKDRGFRKLLLQGNEIKVSWNPSTTMDRADFFSSRRIWRESFMDLLLLGLRHCH